MITASQITELIEGDLQGNSNLEIHGAYDLTPGKELHVSFLNKDSDLSSLHKSLSDLIIVSQNIKIDTTNKSIIFVDTPKASFFKVVNHYFKFILNEVNLGICSSAQISSSSVLANDIRVGSNVVIEDNVKIHDGVSIGPNSYIGKNTSIGSGSIIHPNVSIYNNVKIGKNVIINSGSIIGASGFGIIQENKSLNQVPHIGNVIIEDNVVLGASCTVDRATMSQTVIGEGTKIDGQVHIAHNVRIGKNCIIAGQSAVGGSSRLGSNVILGGQVGIIDNLNIGDNCRVAAKSAVMKSLENNMTVSGIPAIDHRKRKRLDVLISKLPEIAKKKQ